MEDILTQIKSINLTIQMKPALKIRWHTWLIIKVFGCTFKLHTGLFVTTFSSILGISSYVLT